MSLPTAYHPALPDVRLKPGTRIYCNRMDKRGDSPDIRVPKDDQETWFVLRAAFLDVGYSSLPLGGVIGAVKRYLDDLDRENGVRSIRNREKACRLIDHALNVRHTPLSLEPPDA